MQNPRPTWFFNHTESTRNVSSKAMDISLLGMDTF